LLEGVYNVSAPQKKPFQIVRKFTLDAAKQMSASHEAAVMNADTDEEAYDVTDSVEQKGHQIHTESEAAKEKKRSETEGKKAASKALQVEMRAAEDTLIHRAMLVLPVLQVLKLVCSGHLLG
jgi:hypothetical protein